MNAGSRRTLTESQLPGVSLWRRGKVRDVYALGERLLVVASDRLSAFDVVLPTPIPEKGVLLTQLSLFWFERLRDVLPNHVLSADLSDYPEALQREREQLEGRSMLVTRTEPLPVECVVRGYLAGSGYKDYLRTGQVCGIALPAGLREGQPLDPPLFTPATKAASGHDENIDFASLSACVGSRHAERLRALSLELYARAREHAASCGILLADTKFEFGLKDGELLWIDEALTPDSSRFWPADDYRPGRPQASFDKQFVRDYLERTGWDKKPPGPALPTDVVEHTRARYQEALVRLAAGTRYATWVAHAERSE